MPPGTWGLLLSRSSWVLKGLIIHPGVIDEDYTGEIKIMVSLTSGTLTLLPHVPIAQLVLIPRVKTTNKTLKTHRGEAGFGSTDIHWAQIISPEKPYLMLSLLVCCCRTATKLQTCTKLNDELS